MGMTALLKPTELVSAISSQLKALCEANYAAFILKHIIRNTPPFPCVVKFFVTRTVICRFATPCASHGVPGKEFWRAFLGTRYYVAHYKLLYGHMHPTTRWQIMLL